jgi:hypothetical protein
MINRMILFSSLLSATATPFLKDLYDNRKPCLYDNLKRYSIMARSVQNELKNIFLFN